MRWVIAARRRQLLLGLALGVALTLPGLVSELRLRGTDVLHTAPVCFLMIVALVCTPFWVATTRPDGEPGPWEVLVGVMAGALFGLLLLLPAGALTNWRVERRGRPVVAAIQEHVLQHGKLPEPSSIPAPFHLEEDRSTWTLIHPLGVTQELRYDREFGWRRVSIS